MARGKVMNSKLRKPTRKQLADRHKKSFETSRDLFHISRGDIPLCCLFAKPRGLYNTTIKENTYDVLNPPPQPLNSTNSWYYKSFKMDERKTLIIPSTSNASEDGESFGFNFCTSPKKAMDISNNNTTYHFTNAPMIASTPFESASTSPTGRVNIRRFNVRAHVMPSQLSSKFTGVERESTSKESLVYKTAGMSDSGNDDVNKRSRLHENGSGRMLQEQPEDAATSTNLASESFECRSVFHLGSEASLDSIAEDPDVIQIDNSTMGLSFDASNEFKSAHSKESAAAAKTIEHRPDGEQTHQESVETNATDTIALPLKSTSFKKKTPIVMKSGKWRRTVCDLRKSLKLKYSPDSAQMRTFVRMSMNHRKSIFIGEASGSRSHLSVGPISHSEAGTVDDCSANITSINSNQKEHLLRKCGQTDALPFGKTYSKSVLKNCRKIGEGVFGEVFLNLNRRSSFVLKIIPIEGTEAINGAQQKRFNEILQEVIISQELSALRHGGEQHQTAGFVEVLNVRLVEGRYPRHLLNLWKAYEEYNGSENECPECFGEKQLYVVFELANSGHDLEKYKFENADQSYSVFKQVAISLATAESKLQFEHRDLHWGNILIAPTTQKTIQYSLNGRKISIPSNGVKATIIDYTLSRILYRNHCLFQDLSADPELFEAIGDYQYEIYRQMKVHTHDQWDRYEPYTNLLWVHYVIHKLNGGVRYADNKRKKNARIVIGEMKEVENELLDYKSVIDYVEQKMLNHASCS